MLADDFPGIYKLVEQDEASKTYSFPKSYASYRKPRAVNMEQRERARRRMSELNSVETYQGKDGIQTKENHEICR